MYLFDCEGGTEITPGADGRTVTNGLVVEGWNFGFFTIMVFTMKSGFELIF